LWDVASGEEVRLFAGHRREIFGVALSPDGRLALSAGADGTARLWEVATGKEVRRLVGHRTTVLGAVFTADGRRAVSWGMGESPFIVWEVPSGRKLYAAPRLQVSMGNMPVAVSGSLVAWGGPDGVIHLTQMPDAPTGGT